MGDVVDIFTNNDDSGLRYITDENEKIIGVTSDKWPFDIYRNQVTGRATAFVCKETGESFGELPSDEFNEILMAWLLLDDSSFVTYCVENEFDPSSG